jgi:hypothetical protein
MVSFSWNATNIRKVINIIYFKFLQYCHCVLPIVSYDDSLAKACKVLCQRWSDWNEQGCLEPMSMSSDDLKTLSPAQIQEFLAQLLMGPPLSCQAIEKMQQLYSFNGIQNAEIKFRYVLFFIFLSCDVFNKAHFCEDGYVFV